MPIRWHAMATFESADMLHLYVDDACHALATCKKKSKHTVHIVWPLQRSFVSEWLRPSDSSLMNMMMKWLEISWISVAARRLLAPFYSRNLRVLAAHVLSVFCRRYCHNANHYLVEGRSL